MNFFLLDKVVIVVCAVLLGYMCMLSMTPGILVSCLFTALTTCVCYVWPHIRVVMTWDSHSTLKTLNVLNFEFSLESLEKVLNFAIWLENRSILVQQHIEKC